MEDILAEGKGRTAPSKAPLPAAVAPCDNGALFRRPLRRHPRRAQVTEAEWMKSADLSSLMLFLRGKTTRRKRLLFGCACCRLLHAQPPGGHPALLPIVETAERYADDEATEDEYRAARLAGLPEARGLTWEALPPGERERMKERIWEWEAATRWFDHGWGNAWGEAPVPVLREIFYPFPTTGLGEPVRTGTVRGLAAAIYTGRDFAALPVLADALEEAGCTDEAILDHLRGPGPHVRGCWCLDLVLGKS